MVKPSLVLTLVIQLRYFPKNEQYIVEINSQATMKTFEAAKNRLEKAFVLAR